MAYFDGPRTLTASTQTSMVNDIQLKGADLIVKSFDSPGNAPLCIPAIVKAFDILLSGDSEKRLRSSPYSNFMAKMAQLATTPRSDEEFSTLQTQLAECRCDQSDMAVINFHMLSWSELTLATVCWKLFDSLNTVCRTLTLGKLVTRTQRDTGSKWPPHVSALLPSGPKKSLEAFMRWSRFTGRTEPFLLLGNLYYQTSSLIQPTLDMSELIAMVAEGLHECLKTFLSLGAHDINEPESRHARENLLNYDSFVRGLFKTAGLESSQVYFRPHALSMYQDCHMGLIILNSGAMRGLMTATDDPVDHPEQIGNTFIQMGIISWNMIPVTERPRLHAAIQRVTATTLSDPYALLSGALSSIRQKGICGNPKCDKISEMYEKPFQVCSGCNLFRWVSYST